MALIVEDGSLVANANSYVSLADARSYALARGTTLSAVDADLEVQLIVAKDFIEFQASRLKGSKVEFDQSLQYPRVNLVIDNFDIDSDVIPQAVIGLQVQLAIEQTNGIVLFPSSNKPFVTEELVGPIKIRYSGQYGIDNKLPYVAGYLSSLLRSGAAAVSVIKA